MFDITDNEHGRAAVRRVQLTIFGRIKIAFVAEKRVDFRKWYAKTE